MLLRGKEAENLKWIIKTLCVGRDLPAPFRDHPLRGEFEGYRECHIEPDWLLIYERTDAEIVLVRTGTHADLFE